jgi:hypothetical protein
VRIDLKVLGEELATVVNGHVSPILKRLEAVEKRQPEKGERGEKGMDGLRGEPGVDGKDGAPGERGEKGLDGANGQPGERGKDGAPGQRGENGERGEVGPVGPPGPAGPQGERGEKGEPGVAGEKGMDGLPGKDGTPGDRGQPGERGEKGADGINGKDGAPGERGEKGLDGTSVTVDQVMPLLEATLTKNLLEWERRANDAMTKAIERIPAPKDGRDGTDGIDGRDGFGFDDMSVEYDGERGLKFVLERAGVRKTFDLHLPIPIYREVLKSNTKALRGDNFTYGGNLWIARRDTDTRPPGEDWVLAVRKGRDGKDSEE